MLLAYCLVRPLVAERGWQDWMEDYDADDVVNILITFTTYTTLLKILAKYQGLSLADNTIYLIGLYKIGI